jgi:multidrug efflux system membrane fusion protein
MIGRSVHASGTAPQAARASAPGAPGRAGPGVRATLLGAALYLSLVLPLALTCCGRAPEAGPTAFPPAPVTTTPAIARDVPVYLDEIGRCVATESVIVTPRVTGSVAKVEVKDGADLKVDAPLFTIDPRPYEMRLAEAKAREAATTASVSEVRAARTSAVARVETAKSKRDQARAQVTVSKSLADAAEGEASAAASDAAQKAADRDRMEAMGTSGAVSQQDLARVRTEATAAASRSAAAKQRVAAAEAQAQENRAAEASAAQGIVEAEAQLAEADARIVSAEADVLEAKAAVASAQLDVEFCSVKAPIAGRAGHRLVDVGSVVTANVTPLLSIQRVDPIYVEYTITEKELTAVHKYMGGSTLKAEVRLPDAPEPREGDVTFLDNAVDPTTGTVRLRVTVPNADARFWPGRFVRVRMLLATLPGAVMIPAAAPQDSAFGKIVLVAKDVNDPKTGPGTIADMRPVKLGQLHGDLVVVESGLQAGDPVIVERSFLVFPSAPVRVVPPAPPGAGPPGAPGAGAARTKAPDAEGKADAPPESPR